MPKGGARPGAGRPRKPKPPKPPAGTNAGHFKVTVDATTNLNMRVNAAWLSDVRAAAEAAGESVADYVRRAVDSRRASAG